MKLEPFILRVLIAVPETRMLGSEAILGLLPVGITATLDGVESALRTLNAKKQVFGKETDDGMIWKITAIGEARIA